MNIHGDQYLAATLEAADWSTPRDPCLPSRTDYAFRVKPGYKIDIELVTSKLPQENCNLLKIYIYSWIQNCLPFMTYFNHISQGTDILVSSLTTPIYVS